MLQVTQNAAERIRQLLAQEGVPAQTGGLRLGVQGGGCSGLTYAMRLEAQPRDRDQVFEQHGARVFVDAKSYTYSRKYHFGFSGHLNEAGLRLPESASVANLRLRHFLHRLISFPFRVFCNHQRAKEHHRYPVKYPFPVVANHGSS